MQYMFELSGEHPDLPAWEAEAILNCHGRAKLLEKDNLLATFSADATAGDFKERIALSHFLDEHVASVEMNRLEDAIDGLNIKKGEKVSVRVKVAESKKNLHDSNAIMMRLGEILSEKAKIDLESPDVKFRVYIGEKAHIGKEILAVDRPQFEKRKNKLLPFTSPISIHPRLARALINLTATSPKCRILDPFCGTGTILIEAAMMGMSACGSDLSEKMIEGSRKNLKHFNLEAELMKLDVGDISKFDEKFDCIVTDPPYGRSSSTNKEPINKLYARSLESLSNNLKEHGRVGIVIPDNAKLEYDESFRLIRQASIRVHRSLVRNFLILEKK